MLGFMAIDIIRPFRRILLPGSDLSAGGYVEHGRGDLHPSRRIPSLQRKNQGGLVKENKGRKLQIS